MKSLSYPLTVAMTCTLFFANCAQTKMDRQVNEKLSQEQRSDPATLSRTATQRIEDFPNITPEQKTSLLRLQGETRTKMQALAGESQKLRALLIEDMTSPSYDRREVETLKKRIQRVESARTLALFDAIDEANLILGRTTPDRRPLMREMFYGSGHLNF